jgi:hypothetical protein
MQSFSKKVAIITESDDDYTILSYTEKNPLRGQLIPPSIAEERYM